MTGSCQESWHARWAHCRHGLRINLSDEQWALVAHRADRGSRTIAGRRSLILDIKAPPKAVGGFTPFWPLYKVEHTFAPLGRWRRLSRCYEGIEASARARLQVALVGYLLWRAFA